MPTPKTKSKPKRKLEQAAVPTGDHTPVTNLATEAARQFEEKLQPPFEGSLTDTVEAASGDVEMAASRVVLESATEVSWVVPDTSSLMDVGIASFGTPPFIAETVHGNDDRIHITSTDKYPWRAHASLLIVARDNSRWIGTGWFISPRTLITAGHCVYIKNSGVAGRDGWVKSIQVMPGRNGSTLPFGSVTSTEFWSVTGWIEQGGENFDYGAIIIPTELGKEVGWFGFGVYNDTTLAAAKANISGYPGDKPAGTQWYDKRGIASVNPNKLFYDIDTAGGQSGAAVYIIRGGKRVAAAVHAYGGAVTNSATRISPPVYANLTNWKA